MKQTPTPVLVTPRGVQVAAPPPPLQTGGGSMPQKSLAAQGQLVNLSIPAGTSIPLVIAGDNFYFIVSTAPASALIQVRPRGGNFNEYQQGTGLNLRATGATFDMLEVKNVSANPQVVSIWVGFGEYIDNRLILAGSQIQAVVNPTYPTPGTTTTINIPDLSGSSFTDINGKLWLAISRVSIEMTNFATGTDYILQGYNSAVNNGPGVLAVLARTSLIFGVSGNYSISNGGGATNLIVSEVYNAVPPTGL